MIKISAVLLLCFSFGIAQSSANLLSTLKIYGGLGIYQMNTPTHLLHLLKDNGFSSTTITPHPIYIEERRDYPFYRNIPLENGFFQLEIEFSKSIVGGIGVQNDRYGTVNGRTPEKHFAILDYKVTSRYFYSGLMMTRYSELRLYYYPTCFFCIKVLSRCKDWGIDLSFENIHESKDSYERLQRLLTDPLNC